MLTTPHAVTGAAIGALMPSPWLVVPVAIASHFVLDHIPHWQETLAPYTPTRRTYVRIVIDLTLAGLLVGLVASWHPHHTAVVWLGAVAANAPDLDTLTVLLPGLRRGFVQRFWDWHCRIQRETSELIGVYTQLATIAFGLTVSFAIK